MCLNGDNPALTAEKEITSCPHIIPGEVGKRINFCGCCMHYMCDLCAGIHPAFSSQQEKELGFFPCHIAQLDQLLQRERDVETQIAARFHSGLEPESEEATEYHIDTIV